MSSAYGLDLDLVWALGLGFGSGAGWPEGATAPSATMKFYGNLV